MTLPDKAAKEEAEAYAKHLTGDDLKQEPSLNEYVPAYMRDAFLAGAQWRLEQVLALFDSEDFKKSDSYGSFCPSHYIGNKVRDWIERKLKGES